MGHMSWSLESRIPPNKIQFSVQGWDGQNPRTKQQEMLDWQ